MTSKPLVAVVYGTRPEAIKVAPVIRALQDDNALDTQLITTGQHADMVDGINAFFGITPDVDLAIGQPGQTLTDITTAVLTGLDRCFTTKRPDLVLVHGDTTTSTAGALAAYYARIPIGHLEAGLRSNDLYSPYPEEGNRRLTTHITTLNFAPTPSARANLLAENVAAASVIVTGNTVIDALLHTTAQNIPWKNPHLQAIVQSEARIVVVTGHRRESWGGGLRNTAHAIASIAATHPDIAVVIPLHPNPVVQEAFSPILATFPNVLLTEPLDYPEFCQLLSACHCIVTDSGGIQEEAPSLGKPVLVTRSTTERPEAVASGAARLVGTDETTITAELEKLLDDPNYYAQMSNISNPYGDGRAAVRITAAIKHHFGLAQKLPEFSSGTINETPVRYPSQPTARTRQ